MVRNYDDWLERDSSPHGQFRNPTSMMQMKRKQKDPAHFDGKNVEWPSYLAHFEQVAGWNGWGNSEKAAQLSLSLRGTAQHLLGPLTVGQVGDYDALKAALEQRFFPKRLR